MVKKYIKPDIYLAKSYHEHHHHGSKPHWNDISSFGPGWEEPWDEDDDNPWDDYEKSLS